LDKWIRILPKAYLISGMKYYCFNISYIRLCLVATVWAVWPNVFPKIWKYMHYSSRLLAIHMPYSCAEFTTRGAGISIIAGADIHIFVFTDCKNNRFQKKLIGQNTNIWISAPPQLSIFRRLCLRHITSILLNLLNSSKSFYSQNESWLSIWLDQCSSVSIRGVQIRSDSFGFRNKNIHFGSDW
jgi:hypothetical protein